MLDSSSDITKSLLKRRSVVLSNLRLPQDFYALDLETACDVKGCEGFGGACENKHALKPEFGRITLICIWHPDRGAEIFRDADSARKFVIDNDCHLVGQSLKFDLRFLNYKTAAPISLARWKEDSNIAAHVYQGEKVSEAYLYAYENRREELKTEKPNVKFRKAGGLSLKTLAPYFLGVDPFWETEDYDNVDYVSKDAAYSYHLAAYFQQHMTTEERKFYEEKALPWAKMLYEAEMTGIGVDPDALVEREQKLQVKSAALKIKLDEQWKEYHELYRATKETEVREYYSAMKSRKVAERNLPKALEKLPEGFSYSSPTQMLWLLKEQLGLSVENFEGDETTGKSVLKRLADEGRTDIRNFLDWREADKLLTAYIPTYREWLERVGTVHASFNPTGTRTGRLSSDGPNMQQVAPILKGIFNAGPGYKFYTDDLSAIEAKLIAWYSEDAALYEIIEKGWSLHDYNARVFFNLDCPIEKVAELYPAERAAAKRCGFALFYGAGPKRIRESFMDLGFLITESRSREMYQNFKRAFRGAFEFHEEITKKFDSGEIVYNALGRPVKIQHWENAYMQGFNRLVQSTASDLNTDIMYKTVQRARSEGIECYPLLFVHDAKTIRVKEEFAVRLQQMAEEQLTKYKLETQHGVLKITGEGAVADVWE